MGSSRCEQVSADVSGDSAMIAATGAAGSPQPHSPRTIAWLLAMLAVFGIAVSLLAFHEPDEALAVRDLRCEAQRANATVLCEFMLELSARQVGDTVLYIPAFLDSVSVELNGRRVAFAQLYLLRNLRLSTLPAFVPLPPETLREGQNLLRLRLTALPGRDVALRHAFTGPQAVLRPYFHARWFASAVLPTLVVGGEVAFFVVFGLIWITRREAHEFGWLSVTLLLGALRGSVLIPDFGINLSDRPIWNIWVVWEVTAALMFCRTIARASVGTAPQSRGRGWGWNWGWAVPPAVLTLVFMFAPGGMVGKGFLLATMLMICVYLLVAQWWLGAAAARGNQDAQIILLGVVMIFAFMLRDLWVILSGDANFVQLSRVVYGGFLIAVATLMTLRFVRAMRELDNSAEVLRERVAATQAELQRTYEELRQRREAEAVGRERTRLMRDLHDGLGGELVSMLALADAPEPRMDEIAHHARAALTDMRLIISSLEDYGGDLALTLGSWRERAEPQLRSAGIRLVWDMGDVPTLARLGPAQTLDILRIVQEAVTNVIKHARASAVTVETFALEGGVALSIRDDGRGLAADGGGRAAGNGIGNMQARAARLRARLAISHGADGTRVLLVLPR